MNFHYQAKNRSGERTTGAIEAGSIVEARGLLRDQGLFVLTIQPGRAAVIAQSVNWQFGTRRVRKTDLLMVTHQLAIMLQSGVDLSEAIRSIAEHCNHATLKRVLEDVHADVTAGQPVSESLGRHVRVFGEAYVASIAAAEASGTMPDVLRRLADLTQNEIRMRSTVISTITYPAILMCVALAVGVALVGFVLPQFATVFADLGTTPPPLTRFLIDGASWIRSNLHLVGLGVGGVLVVGWHIWASGRLRGVYDRLILTGPMVGVAGQSLFVGRAFRLLGTMLESGVPLLEAIKLCRTAIPNQLYRALFDTLEHEVINGHGIADTLMATAFVPPGAAQMITTAERTGRLSQVMQTVGEFYEDDGERRVKQLAKLLEPTVIVAMGGVVSLVVASIMLPLLDISTLPQ